MSGFESARVSSFIIYPMDLGSLERRNFLFEKGSLRGPLNNSWKGSNESVDLDTVYRAMEEMARIGGTNQVMVACKVVAAYPLPESRSARTTDAVPSPFEGVNFNPPGFSLVRPAIYIPNIIPVDDGLSHYGADFLFKVSP